MAREIWQVVWWSRVGLFLAAWVDLALLPWGHVAPAFNPVANPLVLPWIRWDALWYTSIAARGYFSPAAWAFFPLYPGLIAGLHALLPVSLYTAALLISNAALVLAAGLLYRLARTAAGPEAARRAVWMLLLFPTAFYLSAAYTESLFLALTLAAFLAAERGRLGWAAWWTALASVTRSEGILAAVAVLGAYWRRHRWHWHREAWGLLWLPAGLAAFLGAQWVTAGTPWAFIQAQANWGRQLAAPWAGPVLALRQVVVTGSPLQPAAVLSMIDLGSALAAAGLWIYGVRRRLPGEWLVYWAALVLVDLSAPVAGGESPLLSMSRLVLVAFPMFVVLGMLAAERDRVQRLLVWTLPFLQATFLAIFATWHWIA
ncbi:conserved membrane protein of unknown function [Candidatus Hydrogenisulfobacillus filiaventi]|uniref:Integral membrane protein n=1 Tax=Candidatus Hydrogenisulfobacillus filiaventi TaxID=2707344 RepID=A0A6F8ZE10_9FIRM|nr:mannosyltransferase family protein [Bacillota bacterium]CAB1128108.1 conserved membrane protein of unknown function [Candidatus Hydrogenisulfobacillus filiaventi]